MKTHWFLPETPDVLGTLTRQASVTIAGMQAFGLWAGGDAGQAAVVRQAEHDADAVRRELAQQLRDAFTTPIDQEDLFTLSERLDAVINTAKNVVRDAEALAVEPNVVTAGIAEEAVVGVGHLADAFASLRSAPDAATVAAAKATKVGRHIEKRYSNALVDIAALSDLRAAWLLNEHYRHCLQIGERIELVADRVWYAVVKEE